MPNSILIWSYESLKAAAASGCHPAVPDVFSFLLLRRHVKAAIEVDSRSGHFFD